MNIFISHNCKDKDIVNPIAASIAQKFGASSVFYDSWSILPGDGIIDKMNDGLEKCDCFIFFMSKNSLTSEMVKLEWQNALIKKAKKEIKFLPVKLDNCDVPNILMQYLYIDLNNSGFDVGISQIIDAIEGNIPIFKNEQYENITVICSTDKEKNAYEFSISVKHFNEPDLRLIILIDKNTKDINISCLSDSMYISNKFDNLELSGIHFKAIYVKPPRSITVGFPFKIKLASKINFNILGVLKQITETTFKKLQIKFN